MYAADMHCDTIYKLYNLKKEGKSISLLKNDLCIDVEKLKKGGYALQNFAMFVDQGETSDPNATAWEMIEVYRSCLEECAGVMAPAYSAQDVEKNIADGRISAMLTIEEGAVCRGSAEELRRFYDAGVRMITLTWNYENEIGFPNSREPEKNALGLKERGRELVEKMQELGIVVDVSHLSDGGFWDVCRLAGRPFVASHSNSRAVCTHPRCLTDEMLRALAERGGVAGLNYYPEFLSDGSDGGTLSRIGKVARHMTDVGGIECLGLGSDFDGFDGKTQLSSAGRLPLLAWQLHREGFSDDEIEKIFIKNVLRVYRDAM